MPRVARLVIYDFEDQEELDKQLGRSMNEGRREFGYRKEITVLNVPATFINAIARWAYEVEEQLANAPVVNEGPLAEDYQAAQV